MALAKSFHDLEVWKLGRALRKQLYKIANELTVHERYNLAAQIKAAAISLTSTLRKDLGDIITRRTTNSAELPEDPPASFLTISRRVSMRAMSPLRSMSALDRSSGPSCEC